jgi:hypothetical protein
MTLDVAKINDSDEGDCTGESVLPQTLAELDPDDLRSRGSEEDRQVRVSCPSAE